jgi:F-type H+-transporting ATPase subunit a
VTHGHGHDHGAAAGQPAGQPASHDAHGHETSDSHATPAVGGGLGDNPVKKLLLLLVVVAFAAWLLGYPSSPRALGASARPPKFVAGAAVGARSHDAVDAVHPAGAGAPAAAQHQGAGEHPPAGPAAGSEAQHAGGSGGDGVGVFYELFGHVLPHSLALEGGPFTLFNIQLHQVLALVLMFVVFGSLLFALRSGRRANWLMRVFAGFVLFIRDEMVMPVLGEHNGKKLLPYFLFVFFFVAFQNLIGLAPHGLTPTACIFVTAALGTTTFGAMLILGMKEQGVANFWKHLIPPGLPSWLIPLMVVVEIIGLLVKPFALTIRLFANMMAGHLVVLSCMGLIFYFARDLGNLAYAVAVPSVGLAAFVMIIEGFVALMQAYIFTYLSILFVGACVHPEH